MRFRHWATAAGRCGRRACRCRESRVVGCGRNAASRLALALTVYVDGGIFDVCFCLDPCPGPGDVRLPQASVQHRGAINWPAGKLMVPLWPMDNRNCFVLVAGRVNSFYWSNITSFWICYVRAVSNRASGWGIFRAARSGSRPGLHFAPAKTTAHLCSLDYARKSRVPCTEMAICLPTMGSTAGE